MHNRGMLRGRKHRTVINGEASDWSTVLTEYPGGRRWGPWHSLSLLMTSMGVAIISTLSSPNLLMIPSWARSVMTSRKQRPFSPAWIILRIRRNSGTSALLLLSAKG